MPFRLTEDLKTHNDAIDREHAELLEKINGLVDSCNRGQEKKIVEALNFLCHYVRTHFSHEEVLQRRNHYPHYRRHKRIHTFLIQAVEDVKVKMEKEGFSYELGAVVVVRLGGSILAHILSEDKELAQYLEKHKNDVLDYFH